MENNQTRKSQNEALGINYEHKVTESWKSFGFRILLRVLRYKNRTQLKEKLRTGQQITSRDAPEPPQNLKDNFEFASWQTEERNVFSFAPKEGKTKKHILFLHGGSYVNNNSSWHWSYIETLLNELRCTIIVPDYPLAPTHTYVDAFKFIDPVYKKLISEVDPDDVILMGDSAGGGFALALAQKLKNDGVQQPSHIFLLAPWLEITSTNPEMDEIDQNDPFLNKEALRLAAESYTRGGDINSYLVCPINGPLEGLGTISVFTGTYDILWADAKKFKAICDQKKVVINYFEYPKMIHDWVLFGFAESDHALQQIKSLIQ